MKHYSYALIYIDITTDGDVHMRKMQLSLTLIKLVSIILSYRYRKQGFLLTRHNPTLEQRLMALSVVPAVGKKCWK